MSSFVIESASNAALYTQNFEVDDSANWTVNNGPSDEAHNFFFDYSTIGIPAAPNSPGGTTRGMKLQANLANGIFSGVSASPTGKDFGTEYKLTFNWWANFNGPLFAGAGSGATNLSTFGMGTNGTAAQWPGATQNSVWFGATGDGGALIDWRAYSSATSTSDGYDPSSGVFAAGTGTSPDARNSTHPYFALFGGVGAPAVQLAIFPDQTGNTGVGSAGMQWHFVDITKTDSTVTWTVDGILIATVPTSGLTISGNNIFFGHSDINATSSTDPNDANLLFTLIDNVTVTAVPEAGAFAAVGTVALLSGVIYWLQKRRIATGRAN